MNIFSRIGEALEDSTVWHDHLSAGGSGCGVVPWCGGEHLQEAGTTHVRRVASAVRPDGTTILVIDIHQQFGEDGYACAPVVHVEREHLDDWEEETGLALGAYDAEALAQTLYFGGAHGEHMAEVLLAANELIKRELIPAPRRVLTREGMNELLAAHC